jgi:hypothetical protein
MKMNRSRRCVAGPVLATGAADALPEAGERCPWQARADLLLEPLAQAPPRDSSPQV